MLRVRQRGLLGLAAATTLIVIALGMRAPAALDAALSEALRRNDVGAAHLDPQQPGRHVSYLVIGSDRREGVPRDIAALGQLTGQRADVVMVLLVSPPERTVRAVSLSRYLQVHVADHGTQMLAGALEYGGPAIVDATRSLVGIPIHHYVELDFEGLRNLVDAAGGIMLHIPKPARDRVTHLELGAGEQRLTGDDVLAYVRSRHYEQLNDGHWEPVDTGDGGRIGRQHEVIRALVDRVTDLDDPVEFLLTLAQNVTIDATMKVSELAELRELLAGDLTVRTDVLPTQAVVPATEAVSPFPPGHIGTIGYHVLKEPDATALLHELTSVSSNDEGNG